MKLSKFNYYMSYKNLVYIFNTLSEKIVCIPVPTISRDYKAITTADQNILSELQELGMICEDDIDEDRIYSYWTKKKDHDESCFTLNVYLDNNKSNVSDLFGIETSDDSNVINQKNLIFDSIMSLSSILFSDVIQVNLINCEKVNAKVLKDIQNLLMGYKNKLSEIKINLVYTKFLLEECTAEFLREIGVSNAFLKVLKNFKRENHNELFIVFSRNIFKTDKNLKKIHIIIGIDNIDWYKDLYLIPKELRNEISVHFVLCLQKSICYKKDQLNLAEKLKLFFSAITSTIDLGYAINPIEIIQYPCFQTIDNIISVQPDGKICKCISNPICTVKKDDEKDIALLLYQHILSCGIHDLNSEKCKDCLFLPWCNKKCLIKCINSSYSIENCPKNLYKQLAKGIITVWRKVCDEIT